MGPVSMEQRIEEINRYTVGWTNYYALADRPSCPAPGGSLSIPASGGGIL